MPRRARVQHLDDVRLRLGEQLGDRASWPGRSGRPIRSVR